MTCDVSPVAMFNLSLRVSKVPFGFLRTFGNSWGPLGPLKDLLGFSQTTGASQRPSGFPSGFVKDLVGFKRTFTAYLRTLGCVQVFIRTLGMSSVPSGFLEGCQ